MPPSKPSPKPPATSRKPLYAGLAAVVLAVGVLAYLWIKPASAPVAPAATTPAPSLPAPITTRHIYSETADP
jgi:hypothetical protein